MSSLMSDSEVHSGSHGKSANVSPSLSIPSLHRGFGNSRASSGFEQPKSAMSTAPSPSLSAPSRHSGVVLVSSASTGLMHPRSWP